MKPIRLAHEAVEELGEASGWYGSQRPGLSTEFLDEIHRLLEVIAERPQSFPRLLDPAAGLGIRRALLPRFPYAIVFTELAYDIRVLAFAHAKRRPGYWLHRTHP